VRFKYVHRKHEDSLNKISLFVVSWWEAGTCARLTIQREAWILPRCMHNTLSGIPTIAGVAVA